MTTTTESKRKPGRLTDSKWWFCEIGQHDKCATEVELSLCFEGCPCECHQTAPTQPAPEANGEWRQGTESITALRRVFDADGRLVATANDEWQAAQIVSDHNAVIKLLAIIQAEQRASLWQAALAAMGREEER